MVSSSGCASCIPFHCIICFDEFTLIERPPVVLPCGHTYLCAPCSKRLTRCMECRMPLAWCRSTLQPPPASVTLRPSNKLDGIGMGLTSSPPSVSRRLTSGPQNVEMPRNLVLMALMESSFLQRQQVHSDDDEDNEAIHVNMGMESMNATCGTYAVREAGLVVLPCHPSRRQSNLSSDCNEEEEDLLELSMPTDRALFKLERGQRIQVVRMEDGVATLARNEGYIIATSQQMVKVGGPLDSSCQLEGSLDLVEKRTEKIEKKLEQLQSIKSDLKIRLDQEFQQEPSHPIISPASAFSCLSDILPKTPERRPLSRNTDKNLHTPPQRFGRPHEDPVTPHSIGSLDLNGSQEVTLDFSCSTMFFGDSTDVDDAENDTPTLRGGAEQRIQAPSLTKVSSSSFDNGINWRTGMSGHRALLSAKISTSPAYRGEIRMMSQHNGAARVGRLARTTTQKRDF